MNKFRLLMPLALIITAMIAPGCSDEATSTSVPPPTATSAAPTPTPAVPTPTPAAPGSLSQEGLDRLQAELNGNIEKWHQIGRSEYVFEFRANCFCPPSLTAPVSIIVRDTDTIESVSYVETGERVTENLDVYPTVVGMFHQIQEAIDMRAASLTADYDPETGYPTNVYIDRDFMIADEEQGFEVSSLEPISPPTLDEIQTKLNSSRDKWESNGSSSYEMEYRRICFCAPGVTSPVILVVSNGVIESLTYAETGEPVGESSAQFFPSVSGLFDIVQDAIDREAARITVSYDSLLGFPVSIGIDYTTMIADEELGFLVSGLK